MNLKDRTNKIILIVLLVLYFLFFIYTFPTYIERKCFGYSPSVMWFKISNLFLNGPPILEKYYRLLRDKVPQNTILVSVILNIGNMIFGFIHFKKKWWYYLLLFISIVISIILKDCYVLLSNLE